jgi:hypothetical protein
VLSEVFRTAPRAGRYGDGGRQARRLHRSRRRLPRWLELVVFAYGSIITAVVIAFALILTGRAKLASRIPFGPYLAVGAMLPVLAGPATTSFVRGFLGL